MKAVLGVCLGLSVLVSCGPGKAETQKKQQEDLAAEVLAIHDEVMPKTGEMMKLRKQVKTKLNEWTADAAHDHTEHIRKATALIADLEAADKEMMDWMHTYNGAQGLYEHDEIIAYLGEEKDKIRKVEEKTDRAIASARQFVEENK